MATAPAKRRGGKKTTASAKTMKPSVSMSTGKRGRRKSAKA